jgi:hypothetical protein
LIISLFLFPSFPLFLSLSLSLSLSLCYFHGHRLISALIPFFCSRCMALFRLPFLSTRLHSKLERVLGYTMEEIQYFSKYSKLIKVMGSDVTLSTFPIMSAASSASSSSAVDAVCCVFCHFICLLSTSYAELLVCDPAMINHRINLHTHTHTHTCACVACVITVRFAPPPRRRKVRTFT